jgi:hypothetical protein
MWLTLFARHCNPISQISGWLMCLTEHSHSTTKKISCDWGLNFLILGCGGKLRADLASRCKQDTPFDSGVFLVSSTGDILFHWTGRDVTTLTILPTPSDIMDHLPKMVKQTNSQTVV